MAKKRAPVPRVPRPLAWVHCACSSGDCPYRPPKPGQPPWEAKRLILLGPIPNQPGHVMCLDEETGAPWVAHVDVVTEVHPDDA